MHGSSLKIELRPDNIPVYHFDYFEMVRHPILAPLAANRGWIDVEPGQPYTLSAYLKADPPGLTAILQVRDSPWSEQHTTVQAGDEWERFTFTCQPGSNQAFVCVGPDLEASGREQGTLWIDGVQLEAGDVASDYEPRAPVEVGLQKARADHLEVVQTAPVLALHEPAAIEIVAFNATDEPQQVTARCSLSDFRDQVTELEQPLRLEPSQTASASIELDSSQRAFYRVALEAEGAAVVTNRPLRTAVIEPYAEADTLFGMNHAYPWPELLDVSKQIGLWWFRDWSLKWQHVEPQEGQFDFREADDQIDRVLERGLPVLGLLPFPSSNWGSSAPDEVVATEGYPGSRERMAYMPRDLEEYANYVRTTVEHYQGRISVWEITNEPIYTSYALPQENGYTPADYVKLLQVAYATIKAVDPQLTVLGGIAGPPDTYTREFIEAGGLAYVDGLTLHAYPGLALPEGFIEPLETLLERMEQDGRPRPIWFTEGAYYADDDPPVEPFDSEWMTLVEGGEWEASVLQARFDLILLAFGTRKIIRHSGTIGTINNEDAASIFFEYNAEPRKMLLAQSALANLLGPDTRPLGRLETPEGVYAFVFATAEYTVLAAWALDGQYSLEQVPGFTPLLDVIGNVRGTRALAEEPLFLIGPAEASLGDFQALLTEG